MKDDEEHIGLVKELIRIVYAFGGNKDLFHKKVMETLHVNSLKEKGIIQIENRVLSDNLHNTLNDNNLSEKEYELYCLLEQGFSPKEIAVMLGFKNSRSVYVKQSRLNKKLKASASPEVVFVIFILSIIWCIIISLFKVPGF